MRRLVHFEHQGAMRHVGNLLRGVERHKVSGEIWGEAPAANSFCYFWLNETHFRTQNVNIIRDLSPLRDRKSNL